MSTERPPMPMPLGPGYTWEAEEEGMDWTTWGVYTTGRRCRWGSPRNGYCGRPAAAVLFRGHDRKRMPYGYCDNPEHLYGRWIENDRVMYWRAVRPVSK